MSTFMDDFMFIFLLIGSIFGEVVVFTYKIKFNLPKIAILLFLLYFFFRYLKDIKDILKNQRFTLFLLFLFTLWATFSFVFSPYKKYTQAFPFYLRYLLFPFVVIAFYLYFKKNSWKKVWSILYYFLIFIVGLGGIVEFFWFKQFRFLFKWASKGSLYDPFIQSFLGQHNIFGNVMVFSLWLGFFLFLKKYLNIYMFVIGTGISLFGIFTSTSRGAMFALIVLFFIILFTVGDKRQKFIMLAIFLALVFSFFFLINHYPRLFQRIKIIYPAIEYIKKGDFFTPYKKHILFKIVNKNFSGREGIWERGLELFKRHPIKGMGTGNYRIISKKGIYYNLHDMFLNILGEQGIVGLFIYLILISHFLYIAYLKRKDSFVFYLLVTILASQIFDYFFDYSYLYFILTALLFGASMKENEP